MLFEKIFPLNFAIFEDYDLIDLRNDSSHANYPQQSKFCIEIAANPCF